MTCIAAVSHEGKVYMGGDSAATSSDMSIVISKHPKVFLKDGIVFGGTGYPRTAQLIEHKLVVPRLHPSDDPMAYLCGPFADALRTLLTDNGCISKHDGHDRFFGTWLIGLCGRVFSMECNFQVMESADGFDAVGCGAPFALGALHASLELPPEERVVKSLIVAEQRSAGVRGPFTVISA